MFSFYIMSATLTYRCLNLQCHHLVDFFFLITVFLERFGQVHFRHYTAKVKLKKREKKGENTVELLS